MATIEEQTTVQNATTVREIWVANQSGLPRVPIRAHYRLEIKSTEGSMITEVNADLYDINTPIEITAPN